ncbi:hypothetical protein FRC20_004935, partial [Serendipita sp. 405]
DIWNQKEQSEEARYARAKEQEQLAALKKEMEMRTPTADEVKGTTSTASTNANTSRRDEIEGGLAPGMEDFEDRYATTSGEH